MRCSTKTSRARFTDGLKGTRRQRPPVAGVPLNNASFDPVFIPRLCQNVERACVIHGHRQPLSTSLSIGGKQPELNISAWTELPGLKGSMESDFQETLGRWLDLLM